MAFVLDAGDPSGLGMYSKAGRYTSEKYIIFQRKDDILTDHKKTKKVSAFPSISKLENKRPNPESEEHKPKAKVKYVKRAKAEFDPMSRTITRDQREANLKEKHPAPPVGVYFPKDTLISPKSVALAKYPDRHRFETSQESPRRVQTSSSPTERKYSLQYSDRTEIIPEKPKLKIKGYYSYQNQTSRDKLYSPKNNPHEDRFNYIDYPTVSSKHKKVKVMDMKKTASRNFADFFKSLEYSPDYEPNYDFGKKKLTLTGPRFNLMSPRKAYHRDMSENDPYMVFDSLTKNNSGLSPRMQIPTFNKMTSREEDPSSPLPSFMQTINSRMSMGMLTKKTLISNNYSNGKLSNMYSSFSGQKLI